MFAPARTITGGSALGPHTFGDQFKPLFESDRGFAFLDQGTDSVNTARPV